MEIEQTTFDDFFPASSAACVVLFGSTTRVVAAACAQSSLGVIQLFRFVRPLGAFHSFNSGRIIPLSPAG
jgi:hypothetical protein